MERFHGVATVPTACGIETFKRFIYSFRKDKVVATVPTACGIETNAQEFVIHVQLLTLQQCLPLAVLKQSEETAYPYCQSMRVATAPTACGMYHLNSIKPREN